MRSTESKTYKPLPDNLTIKNSKIEGLGLFATEDIPHGTYLGESHIKLNSQIIRTPLGAFYNHSDEPNAIKAERSNQYKRWYELYATKDIKAGEEITVSYTFYKVQ